MRHLLLSLLLLFATTASAVKARSVWSYFTQPDGSQVRVLPCGDEFSHYLLTEDSVAMRIGDDGWLRPVLQQSGDGSQRRQSVQQSQQRRRTALSRASAFVGKRRALVILVSFSDQDFLPHPLETFNRMFNEVGYSDHGAAGSVHDYFYDQSYGQFDLTFDVCGPVVMSHPYSYYGKNDSQGNDANVGPLVRDACQAIADTVDFSRYDWDADGEADNVYIIYAGVGENEVYSQPDRIWPHSWELKEWGYAFRQVRINGIRINTYSCSNEIDGSNQLNGFGVICHEFSHVLGLPDFYDTDTGKGVLNSWDLMDAGNYNNNGWCPVGYSAYERMFCGWLQPRELVDDADDVVLHPLQQSAEACLVRNESTSPSVDEYYLLENRQRAGWDKYLPRGGLLITHVDYNAYAWNMNSPNNNASHYRYSFIPATGSVGSLYTPFPYGQKDSLTNLSTPAAKVFNSNIVGTNFMCKPITRIAVVDSVVTFRFRNDISRLVAGVRSPVLPSAPAASRVFDLQGRPVDIRQLRPGQPYIIPGEARKRMKE